MKINKFIIICTVILLGTQTLWANYAFSRTVINTCKFYQVTVDESKISYIKLDDGFNLSINLKSNRNNFEMVMLIGFLSVGQAINHQKKLLNGKNGFIPEVPKLTEIKVLVPMAKEKMTITAKADSETILQLTNGEISSAEFMRKIKDSLKTL